MTKRKRNGSIISSKFLRPEQIEDALTEVAGIAADENVGIALAGGIAMQLYGSDRFTQDVDVLATERLPALRETGQLTFGGVTTKTSMRVPVDLIIRDDEYMPLYEAALGAAHRVRGIPIPVVSREYLAAMKLAAGRVKDQGDLAHLILHTDLDLERTRKIVVKFLGVYAGREFDAFVQQVQVLGRAP